MGEFDLIRRYFETPARDLAADNGVVLGIGDDCALLRGSPDMVLAVSSDMLVEGRHFFPDVDPQTLGHKALAVNLSDLAAMGARPLGFTLALALPAPDETWLAAFSQGLLRLACAHRCPLVGGDTTRGPLNLCITVFGEVPAAQALRRDAARAGDDLWLSGAVGEARVALEGLRGTRWAAVLLQGSGGPRLRQRLAQPTPRLALGQALAALAAPAGRALAALDVSDGLVGDLGHIRRASGVGAELDAADLPWPDTLHSLPPELALECRLHGGDDYELLFCAPPALRAAVAQAGEACATPVRRIGRIVAEAGLRLRGADGQWQSIAARGFDHFAP